MKFMSETTFQELPVFGYETRFINLGSCFSENIGNKLSASGFYCYQNPMGIFYHPMPMAEFIERAITMTPYVPADVLERDDKYCLWNAHSIVNAETQELLLLKANNIILEFNKQLKTASALLITFGTAQGFQLKKDNTWVANCHKKPSATFTEVMSHSSDITDTWQKLLSRLFEFNPMLQVVFGVSPVKHYRKGHIHNSISKSQLIVAVHQLVQASHSCYYFPSYEIITDQLRDYRFYTEDFAHPTPQSVDYVWHQFIKKCIHPDCVEGIQLFQQVEKALRHRNSGAGGMHSGQHTHIETLLQRIRNDYPDSNYGKLETLTGYKV